MKRQPVLLDLFCGAGGAAAGYQQAGFYVVGVDLTPQPNYAGDEFIHGDALTASIDGFDAIHASPPCQMFSAYRRSRPELGDDRYVNLIPDTREELKASGLPWVMENVPGAPLIDPVKLCGSMFGLDVQRHRLFEASFPVEAPSKCNHKMWPPNRFPGGRSVQRTGSSKGLVRNTVEVGSWDIPLEVQKEAMGVHWTLTTAELSQAIPPAYTKYLGQALLAAIND